MDVSLAPITRQNWYRCIQLRVSQAQQRFVATNSFSLAQAAYEPDLFPMAIYSGGEMAGMIMYGFDHDAKGWELWYMMVDARFQRRGIGEAAAKALMDLVAQRLGHIDFFVCVEPENTAALSLYQKLGFAPAGEIIHGEIRMKIRL